MTILNSPSRVTPKSFFFFAGLPRSGSTLLGAILSQNPEIFVTPTSPLLDLLFCVEQAWNQIPQTKTWVDPQQLPNVYSGVIQSIFSHFPQPYIIDKHRVWPRNIAGVAQIFSHKPKIICTVRDVPSIVASYLLLARQARAKGRTNFVDDRLKQLGLAINDENFCRILWDGFASDTHLSLKIGFTADASCLHLVEYDDLIADPQTTVNKIYAFLGIPRHQHQFSNIVCANEENDELWGMDDLHRIRKTLERTSPPAVEVLGEKIYRQFSDSGMEFWRE